MHLSFRRHERRQDEDSFVEQFTGFIGGRHTANGACRRFFIVNAARLFRKALADVLRLPRHGHQGLMQLRYSGRSNRRRRIFFRRRHIGRATLDVRRRWQLAYRRGLTLGTMHQMTLALAAKRVARRKPAFEAVSAVTEKIENYHVVPGTGLEPVWLAPRDFKSLVSTNFTTRAVDFTK